ncbi:MAG: efflux RND transporter periplasmic adaptor subunit [Cyanobacteria bacterium P01_F01_bin.53]
MTASSDSSPFLSASSQSPPLAQGLPADGLSIDEDALQTVMDAGLGSSSGVVMDGRDRPNRSWLGLLLLGLIFAGLGFALWRVVGGRNDAGMQGPPAFPVEVERLQESSVEDSSEFVGTLDSQAGVSLQPEANGRVTQIFVNSGDSVAAGDPIMQLSPERSQADYNAALASVSAARSGRDSARSSLRAAEARQSELQADLDLANNDYGRTATLVERGALAQEQLDEVNRDRAVALSALNSALQEIEALQSSLAQSEATLAQAAANANATQQDLFDKTVTAPIAGIVGDIPIKLGDYVTAGSQLATITQNQDLDIEIAVPVNDASRLRVGLPVELTLFGSEEAIATGNLRFVSPTTDPTTQTVLAKARFSTPSQPIQDNQRLEVRVIWDERPGILIPTTAVSRLGGQTFVFVPGKPDPQAEGEGSPQGPPPAAADGPPPTVAKLKPVTLGDLQGNEYQVLEGLAPGETVIVSGLLNLSDGVPIDPQSTEPQPEDQAAGSTNNGPHGSPSDSANSE